MKALTLAIFTLAFASSAAVHAQPALTTTAPVVPPQLKPRSNAHITLHMTDDTKNVYLAVGKLAGINVHFDTDFPLRQIQVDFVDTNLHDTLEMVGHFSGTFYQIVAPDTIFVAPNTPVKHRDLDELVDHTFYIKNSVGQDESNEIVTTLRQMLPPEARVLLNQSMRAIVVRTTTDNIQRAQALIDDLDVAKPAYRLTYTVTEADGSKILGTQHFTMSVLSGQDTRIKQGSKIPIETGSYNPVATGGESPRPAGVEHQITYLDLGMNFNSQLDANATGGHLKFSVEQSSLAPETSGVGPQDPVVRQTMLTGVAALTLNKPTMLGSIDIPGSTRRLDVEVLMTPIP